MKLPQFNISGRMFSTVWLGAIVVCLLFCLFGLFFSSCSAPAEDAEDESGFTVTAAPDRRRESDGFSATEASETASGAAPAEPSGSDASVTDAPDPNAPSPVRLTETADGGREYLDRIVFLGDSTTYGIGYYYERGFNDLCPPSQVWTPASGTLTLSNYATATVVYPETGEELGIVDAVTRSKPDILLITLGVNGVSFMDESWFIRDYTALVQSIQQASPDTKIILNSIYPVAASYPYIDQISNEKIRAANDWIERIASGTGARFLYSYEAVVGEDGTLPDANQNGDGIHLSGEGFTKVMQYIRTHMYQ